MNLEETKNKEWKDLVWVFEKFNLHKKRLDVILKIYFLLGIIMGIFGLLFLLFSRLEIKFNAQQRMVLLISGIGFTLAIMSRILLLFRKEKETNNIKQIERMQIFYDFLANWSKFETVSKAVLQKEGEKFNKYSIREINELLYKEGKLDRLDLFVLEDALHLRNLVVHQGEPFYLDKVNKLNDALGTIINKVSRNP